jgi:diaminopimelate epimerase
VGADGDPRVVRTDRGARFFMDYTNADSSTAECGNGIQCVGGSCTNGASSTAGVRRATRAR